MVFSFTGDDFFILQILYTSEEPFDKYSIEVDFDGHKAHSEVPVGKWK